MKHMPLHNHAAHLIEFSTTWTPKSKIFIMMLLTAYAVEKFWNTYKNSPQSTEIQIYT